MAIALQVQHESSGPFDLQHVAADFLEELDAAGTMLKPVR